MTACCLERHAAQICRSSKSNARRTLYQLFRAADLFARPRVIFSLKLFCGGYQGLRLGTSSINLSWAQLQSPTLRLRSGRPLQRVARAARITSDDPNCLRQNVLLLSPFFWHAGHGSSSCCRWRGGVRVNSHLTHLVCIWQVFVP